LPIKPRRDRDNRRPDPLSILRQILAQNIQSRPANAGSANLGPLGENSLLREEGTEKSSVRQRITTALRGIEILERMIPRSFVVQRVIRGAAFKDFKVYPSGEIQAVGSFDGVSYNIFVDPQRGRPPAGCSCDQSEGEYPCPHVYALVLYLIKHLREPDARLTALFSEQGFTPGSLDRSIFKPDLELLAISKLDSIISSDHQSHESGEVLPPSKKKAIERLVWNVSVANRSVAVTAMIQKENKRGNGFNKPKETSFDRLLTSNDLQLAPIDRQMLEVAIQKRDTYGYGGLWNVDVLKALQVLANHSLVFVNGHEGRIEHQAFVFGMNKISGQWVFQLEDQRGQPIHRECYLLRNAIIRIDANTNVVTFSEGDFDGYKMLMEFPPVSEKHAETLFEKARNLQGRLPLRLPEEVGGPLVEDRVGLLILLRSRADGVLDYGLRVRDSSGRIRLPGATPAVRTEAIDGKPIQKRRDLAEEVARCLQLAKRLEIEPNHTEGWHGAIDSWETGLLLIERLQTSADEVEVLWEKSSDRRLTVLGQLSSKNVKVDITSKRDWFGISGTCDFGTQTLPLDQLLESLPAAFGPSDLQGDYVQIAKGQWAKVSADLRTRLMRLRDAMHSDRKKMVFDATSAPAIRELMQGDIEVKATKSWHECLARLSRAEQLEPALPAGLNAELRDYQLDGYKWLRRLAEWGVGGVLADDMGLGKTLQTLAVLLDRRTLGPALVIAPTSVGFNWVREAERFTPDLKIHLYRETDRAEFLGDVGPGDLVICSYGLALRDAEALAKVSWGTLVMDEAQAVKNSRSKTAQAIASFDAQWSVALTGTPVENHLGELWSLFHLVSPGVLGGWDQFRNRFATPIEKHSDDNARRSLANRMQPFVLRRSKSQVLKELPPRTEMNLYVDLSPEERQQYELVRRSALGEIDQIAALPSVQDQRFKLLALLTRLRQFSCHPGIVNKQWTGSSAKLDQLCETIEELRQEGHRALIFSQFTQHLALIRAALDRLGVSYQYLDGATAPQARQQRVDAFQSGEGDCFLISLKAGGTGLNLTGADYVIHMDPWWNPAVEDQATDRAHRMGQDRPVMVYRIIARGTIEEEILSLHDSKRDLVAGVLEGTSAAGSLSTKELIAMLRGD